MHIIFLKIKLVIQEKGGNLLLLLFWSRLRGSLRQKRLLEMHKLELLDLGFVLARKERRKQLVVLIEDAENERIVGLGRYKMQAKWLSVGIDNMRYKDLT